MIFAVHGWLILWGRFIHPLSIGGSLILVHIDEVARLDKNFSRKSLGCIVNFSRWHICLELLLMQPRHQFYYLFVSTLWTATQLLFPFYTLIVQNYNRISTESPIGRKRSSVSVGYKYRKLNSSSVSFHKFSWKWTDRNSFYFCFYNLKSKKNRSIYFGVYSYLNLYITFLDCILIWSVFSRTDHMFTPAKKPNETKMK